ncbi:MAG: PfaD family polyunsaturated fatty acid/polyketide biosynthesis protein [Sandaracinus sp.]
MSHSAFRAAGDVAFSGDALAEATTRFRETTHVVRDPATGAVGVAFADVGLPVLATLPPLYPEWLGDRAFNEAHRVRFPYATGAMANGIATTRIVIEMARAEMLGFFGAAGLGRERVEAAVDELMRELGPERTWGVNLIHSPNEPALEAAVADMLIRRGVRRVEASAFMGLTPAIVRYAVAGLRQAPDGTIVRERHVMAKVSRPEVARHFMSPAPAAMLAQLVKDGLVTAAEAQLAAHVPIADDVTMEADSGGHTDNRTLTVVLPILLALRDELAQRHGYATPIRVGAAGGLGAPGAVAAAFALGASYVLTGSVNQSAVESGLSEAGRAMLATAGMADVVMAPAADMFELGVKVQVLKRGTMFAPRAQRLYEVYVTHESIEQISDDVRARLEKEVLGQSLDSVWAETQAFWSKRDPHELAKADASPKHKMALCFRWYLGLSSRWAITGEPSRKLDYQVWCGPAMGAFNDWVKGSFLEPAENRSVVQIARNLLEGAAAITRAHQLRTYGAPLPAAAFRFAPRPLE